MFSDAANQSCLTLRSNVLKGGKVLFTLLLTQRTGKVASLLKLAGLGWDLPGYTTLCRRQKTFAVQMPYWRVDGPLNLLVDSSGSKFVGDGEWQGRKHGVQGRRHSSPGNGLPPNPERWRKGHLAMDTATSGSGRFWGHLSA